MKTDPGPAPGRGLGRNIAPFVPIYFFLALINLTLKIRAAPGWFDGLLAWNHHSLLDFAFTNNEQSRLFQFAIPELLVRLFGLSVEHAYLVQRLVFVWLALTLFHVYLRHWFGRGLAFAGAALLAAVMPLTYLFDLQESFSFLMVSFLLGLWAIRAGRPVLFTLALVLGALDNETTLVLPAVYFFTIVRGWHAQALWDAGWRSVACAAPAYLVTGVIRYVTRHQEHLGGAWHLTDNFAGIWKDLQKSPLDYYGATYLSAPFVYGVLWVYAFLGWSRKPRFLRAGLLMVPFFLVAHLITGIISESRQMMPLAYVIIPAAFFWLFGDEPGAVRAPAEGVTSPSG
jgi:hypothetical protein